jgi:amino acid permease
MIINFKYKYLFLVILTLPYSLTKTGVLLGFILFLISTSLVLYTATLLVKVASKNNCLNYSGLVLKYFGTNHTIFFEIINLIINLGTIIIYQQISKFIMII